MSRILQVQVRRGTAAAWTTANPTLAAGEIGLETDTHRVKYGDGATAWTGLAYPPGGSTGSPNLPYYAPSASPNDWDAERSWYNVKPSNMHSIRAALTKLGANTAPMHVLFIGDSTLVGYNGATYDYKQSIPYRFGMALADRIGCPYPTTGLQEPLAAAATLGDRWTTTGGFTTALSGSTQLLTCSGAGTASWVTPDPCTSIEFYVSNLTTSAQLKWQVDGGTLSAAITTTGAGTIQKVSITGLTNGIHTLKLTAASGNTYITATRPLIPAVNQLHVHNMALGGGHATTGTGVTAGMNWSDTTTTGLGNSAQLTLAASGVTPDALVIVLGNNDAHDGTAAATILTALTTVRNLTQWASIPVIFVHPPMVAGTNSTLFDTLSGGYYNTLADTLDCAFLDWNALVNTQASMSADGLIGADTFHPVFAEQNRIGHALADLFAGPLQQPARSTYWPNIVGNRLIESAGAYPIRPNWPAGWAQYAGADAPTDSLPGDGFSDLP